MLVYQLSEDKNSNIILLLLKTFSQTSLYDIRMRFIQRFERYGDLTNNSIDQRGFEAASVIADLMHGFIQRPPNW